MTLAPLLSAAPCSGGDSHVLCSFRQPGPSEPSSGLPEAQCLSHAVFLLFLTAELLAGHHHFFISVLVCFLKDGGARQTLKGELSEISNFVFFSTICLFKDSKACKSLHLMSKSECIIWPLAKFECLVCVGLVPRCFLCNSVLTEAASLPCLLSPNCF